MEKNLDITNPRYNEPISPVPWHFVKSRFHCIIPVLTGMKLCNGLASSLGEEWGAGFSIGIQIGGKSLGKGRELTIRKGARF